jgi:hypothetical protein
MPWHFAAGRVDNEAYLLFVVVWGQEGGFLRDKVVADDYCQALVPPADLFNRLLRSG